MARANVNISTVEKLTFTSTDGIGITLTKQELLDTPRFYFPGIKENSEEGKVPVEPILALLFHSARNNDQPNFEAMDDLNALRLSFGQKNVNEATYGMFAKWVTETNHIS